MFDFGNANDGQRQAIATADGPVLITAGPGTGKTYTLVQRTIYLIEECDVRPESIFIATFTEKAAKELVTRITNELASRNITANINEMYIGTFHALCLRILKEHLEYTRLRRNYRLMDSFDQQYMVFQNIHRFRCIPEIEIVLPNGGAWKQAETICNFVNNLSEELVSPEELMSDRDPSIASLGRMLQEYRAILTEENLMDFSSIQIEAYRLLCDHEDILKYNPKLVKKIDIYNSRYAFSGETFECMISLTTQKGNLPSIQLSDDSQLTVYECPQLPVAFSMPEYKNEVDRKSRKPDFRHTLYWNPSVKTEKGKATTLLFYTSDLEGEFKVVVEGFTHQGEAIRGETSFRVGE